MKTAQQRWRWFFLVGLVCWCQIASAGAPTQAPRMDPAGIKGALLLCGGGEISAAALEKFFELAGGAKAKIVVVMPSEDRKPKRIAERLAEYAEKKQWPAVKILLIEDALKNSAALKEASGVWWAAGNPIQDVCSSVLQRGGVIAVAGVGSESLAKRLLPDAIVVASARASSDAKLKERMKDPANAVGYDIEPGAALLVAGRALRAVGAGKITIFLGSKSGAVREITLQGNQQQDLTALRRAARDRAQGFPPARPDAPFVDKGTLIIVGGGGVPDGMHKKIVDLAGGKDRANIVIFPTAQPDPVPKKDATAAAFRKAGARKVTVLAGRTLAEVESKESLDMLREATGLWFDGGRQWRFVDCYENTKALPLMFDVLARGGVIGGSSAGATIQGDYLCRGGVFNNFDIRYEGYERGLGFLKGVAIDQHFTQRKRHADMTSLMKIYPQYLGIGLDEATAIVVQGSGAEVIGRGKAHFYDAKRSIEKGQPDYEALSAGGRYDLKGRKVVGTP